jgi:rhodanese-related sulfurtransferase
MMMVIRKISATFIILIVFAFVSVTSSGAGLSFKTIDTEKLHSIIVNNAYEIEAGRAKQFIVIDARTKREYEKAHIFSSINIPEVDFENSLNLIPRDREVLLIVYCNDTKNETSQKWAEKAAAAGYFNIVIYKDGFQTWKKTEMPIAPLSGF